MNAFDAASARPICRRAGGSPHPMFEDDAGSACLVVTSRLGGGGFAVSVSGFERLRKHPGGQFVRFRSPVSRLDVILPADQVPLGRRRSGELGDYYIVEADDLRDPMWPPLNGDGGTGSADDVPFG